MIQKNDLLDALQTAAPALSKSNVIEALSYFWFRGDHVMAFNDQIAISTPLKTEFVGALPGDLLLKMLKTTSAKVVSFVPPEGKNKTFLLKAGAAKIKLPVLDAEKAFIFDIPKIEKNTKIVPSAETLSAFETCLISVSSDTSIPDQLGITVVIDGKKIELYSTNNLSLSFCRINIGQTLPKMRMILPTLFCNQMLKLAKDAKDCWISFQDDHAIFFADGTTLFGSFVSTPKPLDFQSLVKQHEAYLDKGMIEIPSKLKKVIERSILMTDPNAAPDQSSVQITAADGKMVFLAKSAKGEVRDSIPVTSKAQKDLQILVDPRLLKTGVDRMVEFLATKNCVIMRNEIGVYLISVSG